jgi:mono/diheme cytochrome c family protein
LLAFCVLSLPAVDSAAGQRGDVGENGAVVPAFFLERPGSFSDGGAPVAVICQACHTETSRHDNDDTDLHHRAEADCASCHKYEDGFAPSGCTGCHSRPQNARRQIVTDAESNPGGFGQTSHHIQGRPAEDADCMVCHYTADHGSQVVKLLDPDLGGALVHEFDPSIPYNSAIPALENFCLACHDADGAQNQADPYLPFSDGRTPPNVDGQPGSLWADSAHKLESMTGESFTESQKRDLGDTFTAGDNTYTIQCSACHNPQVVTGQYRDANLNVSPETRPNLSADPETNPRAMGSALWDAAPGEKMDEFVTQDSGAGGWYFSTARGGVLVNDQPAEN